jgi:hypothetical protein
LTNLTFGFRGWIFVISVIVMSHSGCGAHEDESSHAQDELESIHRADVARFLSDPASVPVEAFATVQGTFRLEGKPAMDFEVGYKPGTLSGNNPWETVVDTVDLDVAGVLVTSMEIYPDEPWTWHPVKASDEGEYSIAIGEECETATIFIRLGDGKVVSQVVKGLKKDETRSGVEIRSQ